MSLSEKEAPSAANEKAGGADEKSSANRKLTQAELKARVEHIAGYPRVLQQPRLEGLAKEQFGDDFDIASLQAMLLQANESREKGLEAKEYAGLKLKTLLKVEHGTNGTKHGGGIVVPNPLNPGVKIIVRDATILGHRPIVEAHDGHMDSPASIVVALIGNSDVSKYQIDEKDVLKVMGNLQVFDNIKMYTNKQLATANLPLIQQVADRRVATLKKKRDEASAKREHGKFNELIAALSLNQSYSLVENAGQISIYNNRSQAAYVKATLVDLLANRPLVCCADGKYRTIFEVWWKHPVRIQFDKVVFAPESKTVNGMPVSPNAFNLWPGFPELVPTVGAKWDRLKEHIRDVICDGDQDACEYVLNWLAHLFQRPWDKPGVAIVAFGEKRTGKGTVADAIRAALGPELSRMIQNKEHLLGRFASGATPALFYQVEEALYAKNHADADALKTLITDPQQMIELKFKTPYQVDSFSRFWFNSNHETPVPITPDETRFFVLRVSSKKRNDTGYFATIRKQLYEEGGLAAMVQELLRRDISKFDVRKPPKSKYRDKMSIELADARERALLDILKTGRVAVLNRQTGSNAAEVALSDTRTTAVPCDLVVTAVYDAFREYKGATLQSEVTKFLRDMKVLDATRGSNGVRSANTRDRIEATYYFLPRRTALLNFAEKHGYDAADLLSEVVLAEMTPETPFIEAGDALKKAVENAKFAGHDIPNLTKLEKLAEQWCAVVSASTGDRYDTAAVIH